MRMMLKVCLPNEPFNAAVRDGTIGEKIGRILEETKPEAVYFTEEDGRRAAMLIVDLAEPSQIPPLAEPWFLAFDAECHLQIAMTPEDLEKSGINQIGEKWAI